MFCARKVEVASSHLLSKISALEVSHANKPFDSIPGGLAVTLQQGLKILERDDYRCQYCGLDGRASFENALVMSVDFVVPRARKGRKDPQNLVACCRPCNTIKGTRVYANLEEAKEHVLAHREELRKAWESKTARPLARSARA